MQAVSVSNDSRIDNFELTSGIDGFYHLSYNNEEVYTVHDDQINNIVNSFISEGINVSIDDYETRLYAVIGLYECQFDD